MMKSPRTPKIDITLKKPLTTVPNLKNVPEMSKKVTNNDKSEVIPYYSRIKAMATSNVVPIEEDGSSKNDGKL